jgi:hypothetical protein
MTDAVVDPDVEKLEFDIEKVSTSEAQCSF